MSRQRPLRGACSCGRNRYTVEVPSGGEDGSHEHHEVARVLFDCGSSDHRRHHAAPLTAFLRIPLSWYHSATYSFLPDESHTSIRRAYTSPQYPHAKRHFCGYCGTPLSYWTEEPRTEADYISLTLGSLLGEDLRELEELGLVPAERAVEAQEEVRRAAQSGGHNNDADEDNDDDDDDDTGANGRLPWFDTLLEGSRLAKLSRSSRRVGRARSRDGSLQVEWEIVEWTDVNDDDVDMAGGAGAGIGVGGSNGKRKIGDLDEPEGGKQRQEGDGSGDGSGGGDVEMKE